MAEGWARFLQGDIFECFSAGIAPQALDALAVSVMREAGVDISSHSSKHLDLFRDLKFDLVVTVCDSARDNCPVAPAANRLLHVSFDDPPRLAATARNREEALSHYRRVRDEIGTFIKSLPAIIEGSER